MDASRGTELRELLCFGITQCNHTARPAQVLILLLTSVHLVCLLSSLPSDLCKWTVCELENCSATRLGDGKRYQLNSTMTSSPPSRFSSMGRSVQGLWHASWLYPFKVCMCNEEHCISLIPLSRASTIFLPTHFSTHFYGQDFYHACFFPYLYWRICSSGHICHKLHFWPSFMGLLPGSTPPF